MGFFPQRGHDSKINKVYLLPLLFRSLPYRGFKYVFKDGGSKQLNRFDLIKLKDLCSMKNKRKIAK